MVLQVLVLKESTEVREVAVPPLALTADGRTVGEAPAENGSAATSPRELALALALQVCPRWSHPCESIVCRKLPMVAGSPGRCVSSQQDPARRLVPMSCSLAGGTASAATAAGPQCRPSRARPQGLLHVAHRELPGVQGDHGDPQDLQQVWRRGS